MCSSVDSAAQGLRGRVAVACIYFCNKGRRGSKGGNGSLAVHLERCYASVWVKDGNEWVISLD